MNKQEGICPECGSDDVDFIERYQTGRHNYNEVYRCMNCECIFTENFRAVYQDYTIIQNGNNSEGEDK